MTDSMTDKSVLDSIFPANVHYRIADPWMWETLVHPQEEALVERAVDKRKREFRAGRHAARALFNQCEVSCGALLKGVQREPGWPAGWTGSISHTQGICMVALASTSHFASLGLDVEQATPLGRDLADVICRPEELLQLRELEKKIGTAFALEKLLFSAKESVHKTYFPLNHHTLDFLDARIELDWAGRRFTAFILNPEPAPRVKVGQLQGRFCFYGDWVVTCIANPA
jgi:4'-phosphopantetheinyl transferase EntD